MNHIFLIVFKLFDKFKLAHKEYGIKSGTINHKLEDTHSHTPN